jgi:hypothetical protein
LFELTPFEREALGLCYQPAHFCRYTFGCLERNFFFLAVACRLEEVFDENLLLPDGNGTR